MLPLRDRSSLRKCALTSVALGLIASASAMAREPDVVVAGPVESVDCGSGVARVLGVSFHAGNSSGSKAICSLDSNSGSVFVVAKGQAANNEVIRLIDLRVVSTGVYVSGVSSIYLRGTVTAARAAIGQLSIYGANIVTSGPTFPVGTRVEILGSQPQLGGSVLPAQTIAANAVERPADRADSALLGAVVQSSSGSGILSSAGSEIDSSSGSGLQSSAGSGLNSSSGSGKASSSGSGLQSSSGSGLSSSSGSGLQSSAGSGLNSSSGSGKSSSSGSGLLSSSGSGLNSSSGSGKLN